MQVIGAIFFFICLSFVIVIFGVVVFAMYLKNKMTVFKEVQMENEAYHNEPYVDADFYSIGHETPAAENFTPATEDVIDTTYRVLPSGAEEAESSESE